MFTYLQIQTFEASGCMIDGVPTLKCLEVVFYNVLLIAAALVVLILFVMFVVGSFQYLTSQGEPGKVAGAQKTIGYAIAGLVLFMSSYLILNIVQFVFLGDPSTGAPNLLKFEIPEFKPGSLGAPTPTP